MLADIIRGTLTIVIIMIISGVIAYVGDRVGHQVGRKRLTLFGIRPRYTSTIVAVGTGMFIALLAMVIAIAWSQQVKTALFRMNQISAEISSLQVQKNELENKVNSGTLVVPVDTLMVPFFWTIKKNTPPDTRLSEIRGFYKQAVSFLNANETPRGLKKFVEPADLDKKLEDIVTAPRVSAMLLNNDVIVSVTADQNLYVNDPIHFQLLLLPDSLRLPKGQNIASLIVPAGKNTDVDLAVGELEQIVKSILMRDPNVGPLPPFLATNVRIVQAYPDAATMQATLKKGTGNYVITAFAATDIYPHTGGVPLVITLTKAK